MNGLASVTADGQVRLTASNGSIDLGLISADRVNLFAFDSILDGNSSSLNVLADSLTMEAQTGIIGGPDVLNAADSNLNAIDTQVNTLAASANLGIYVREIDGVTIDDTLDVQVTRVFFNSTSNGLDFSGLEDLTTVNGAIKLLSEAGNIVVNPGATLPVGISAGGDGDVLLQTQAANGDIVVNAVVQSGTGDISLRAGDDIDLNANVTTTGAGTIFFSAGNGNVDALAGIDMQLGTQVSNTANIHFVTANLGDIRLSLIDGGAGRVYLSADGSIIDNVGADLRLGTDPNVRAGRLAMVAVNGRIGDADLLNPDLDANINAIDTSVDILAARAALGIYVQESDSVTVDDTNVITVRQVNFNSTNPVRTERLEDLTTTNNGPIKLLSLTGSIIVNAGVVLPVGISAHGLGDVLLQTRATDGDIVVNAVVQSGTGDISLRAGDDIDLNANVTTTGAGTIFFSAGNANVDALAGIDMQLGTQVSNTGNIHFVTSNLGDIRLSLIDGGTGRVYLSADRSIIDNVGADLRLGPDPNVRAGRLAMVAVNGRIGNSDVLNLDPDANINAIDTSVDILAARAALGIYVQELNTVTVDDTGVIAVRQVNFNSTDPVRNERLDDLTTNNGPIKLLSLTGSIIVNPGATLPVGISAGGDGDVLLQTRATNGDIVVNAVVQSGTGDISLRAGDDIDLNANVTTTGTGTIFFSAGNGNVDALAGIDMQLGTQVSNTGNIHFVTANLGDIRLSLIDGGTGRVYLSADGSIIDNVLVDLRLGTGPNVRAEALAMVAVNGRIGDADLLNPDLDANINAIDTSVDILAARAALGIYVQESDSVTVDDTNVITVRQVNFNSTELPRTTRLEDLTTTNNGPIKLLNLAGSIVVNPGLNLPVGISAHGLGDVLLHTRATNGDIVVNAVVQSGTGDISLRAGDDIDLNANVTTTGAGTIFFSAGNANVDALAGIDMQLGTQVSNTGNIHFVTSNLGDIRLSLIDGGTGRVYLSADRSIIDNVGADLRLGPDPNVRAGRLAMVAVNGRIGNSDVLNLDPDANINAIDTSVDILAARAALGIYVQELNTVTVDDTGVIAVRQVNFNSTDPVRNERLEDLRTPIDGPIKLLNLAGDIIVNPGIAVPVGVSAGGSGDVLLQAFRNLDIRGDIVANTGNISLIAGDNILQQAAVRTGGVGSILMLAGRGISMNGLASVTADGLDGQVRLTASNGSIDLGLISANRVNLFAFDSILDGNSNLLNVLADSLTMRAQTGIIGGPDVSNAADSNLNAIDTQVNTLAASANLGIYVREIDGVTIDVTPVVQVNRVFFRSTSNRLDFDGLEDLTTVNGPIKLLSEAGNIVVNRGATLPVGISAGGDGDLLLQTRATNGDIVVNGEIQSGTGDISLRAGDDIDLNANVTTTGTGTIFFSAGNGNLDALAGIDMQLGTQVSNTGNIHFVATNGADIRLTEIKGGAGRVFLSADRSIIDVNGAALNVTAGRLAMVAVNGRIGDADLSNPDPDANINAIDTSVDILAARAALGIYVQESNSVTVDDTDVITVRQVNFNSTDPVRTERLEDLTTTNNGPIKLLSLTGSIIVNAGVVLPVGISAHGLGDVLLQTRATNGDIVVNGEIRAGSGDISIRAADDVSLNANVRTTSGSGSIQIVGNNGNAADVIGVSLSASIQSAGGDVLIVTRNGSNLLVGVGSEINSIQGSIAIEAAANIEIRGTINALSANEGVFMSAGGVFTMASNAKVIASEAIVLQANGDVSLAYLEAQNVHIASVTGSILDGDLGTDVDIKTSNLRMTAAKSIGLADAPDTSASRTNAIDVENLSDAAKTTTLAASAKDGIFILQTGGSLEVNRVNASSVSVSVQNVNFNSTEPPVPSSLSLGALNDLISTKGAIHVTADDGSITINDGSVADGIGVSARNAIFLIANDKNTSDANESNIQVKSNVVSLVDGKITIEASKDITVEKEVKGTKGDISLTSAIGIIKIDGMIEATDGKIAIEASKDITVSGTVKDAQGDISLKSNTESITIGGTIEATDGKIAIEASKNVTVGGTVKDTKGNISLKSVTESITIGGTIEAQDGNIAIEASKNILVSGKIDAKTAGNINMTATNGWINDSKGATVQGAQLTLTAGQYAFLSNTSVNTLTATVTKNGELKDEWQEVNVTASNQGSAFLDSLNTKINALKNVTEVNGIESTTSQDKILVDLKNDYQFKEKYKKEGYGLFVKNDKALTVNSVSVSGNEAVNIYLETLNSGELKVAGKIQTNATTDKVGGIVLVAGGELDISGGELEVDDNKEIIPDKSPDRRINSLDLKAKFYDYPEGSPSPNGIGNSYTTEFVLADNQRSIVDLNKHFNQRVAMKFGSSGEAGFEVFLSFADGFARRFDRAGDVGAEFEQSPFGVALTSTSLDVMTEQSKGAVFQRMIGTSDETRREGPIDGSNKAHDDFLQNLSENNLPTNAVVRRSNNFFLFENASPNDSKDIKDLTFASDHIDGVKALGYRVMYAPKDVEGPTPVPMTVQFVMPFVARVPDAIEPPEIELVKPTEAKVEVAIYRIASVNDRDHDGQIDENELPTSLDIESGIYKKDLAEAILKIRPKGGGGEPTVEEIENAKQSLLEDPNMPSGAYSIIKTDTKKEITVIDVFSIRDFEEETADASQDPASQDPIVPNSESSADADDGDQVDPIQVEKPDPAQLPPAEPQPEDGAQLAPSVMQGRFADATIPEPLITDTPRSRFAASGALLGAFWAMTRVSKPTSQPNSSAEEIPAEFASVGFDRSQRRRRKLAQECKTWNQP